MLLDNVDFAGLFVLRADLYPYDHGRLKDIRMKSRFGIFVRIAGVVALLAVARTGVSQALYSYVDERGIRTFTNIPPTGSVRELKVTGVEPTPAPAPASVSAKSAAALKKVAFDPIIEKYAPQFQLDPQLVRSMITQESGFKANAVSPKGARGLMQLMPATAARLGVRNSFDPEENIRGGMQHMRNLLNMFDNDLELSLAAYNAGENLVQKIRRVPSYRETRDYVASITTRYGKKEHEPRPPAKEVQAPAPPQYYRYFDNNGVLHMTNIPPVPRPEVSSQLSTGTSSQ